MNKKKKVRITCVACLYSYVLDNFFLFDKLYDLKVNGTYNDVYFIIIIFIFFLVYLKGRFVM